jgi:hypothetical protein
MGYGGSHWLFKVVMSKSILISDNVCMVTSDSRCPPPQGFKSGVYFIQKIMHTKASYKQA